jgi:hypothetical protein
MQLRKIAAIVVLRIGLRLADRLEIDRDETFMCRKTKVQRHTRRAVMAVACLLASAPAFAHHSFAAEFDINRPVHLAGQLARLDWSNPHIEIFLDVKEPDGHIIRWMVEGASPNALARRGIVKAMLLPGAELIVDGYQAKSGAHYATGEDVILPCGRKLFLRSDGAAR